MPKYKTSKEEILAKAYEVFKNKGYHQTKLSDLAEACGLEKPHFYYYFKNKKQLMKDVLRFAGEKMDEWVFDKAFNEAFSPEQRIRKMTQNLVKIHLRHFDGCIMGNTVLEAANTEPDLMQGVSDYFQKFLEAFEYIYGKVHTEADAKRYAQAALKEIQGSIILMRLYKDSSYLQEAAENIVNRFLGQQAHQMA